MKSAPASKDIRLILQQVAAAAANLPIVGSPPEVTPISGNSGRTSGSKPKPKAQQRVITKPSSAKKTASKKALAPAKKAAAKKKPAPTTKVAVKKKPTAKKVATKGKKR